MTPKSRNPILGWLIDRWPMDGCPMDGLLILRWGLIATVLCVAIAPALPLVVSSLVQDSNQVVVTDGFYRSTISSLWLGSGVSVLSLAIGLPLGLLASLYRFPGRRPLVVFQALPLLMPSFLLCIGWSNLAGVHSLSWLQLPDGLAGCVFVKGMQMMPLPFFATWAACRNLTAIQIDAARLHGGEGSLLRYAGIACVPVAILAALLGGIISLADPGAPLIFGCRSVAVEIRTSFSALFDYRLAGRQCLLLAALATLLTAPVLLFGLRRIAAATLARQTRPTVPYSHRVISQLTWVGLVLVLVVGIFIPALGLCLPALNNPMIGRAIAKVGDTAITTLIFTSVAAVVAVFLATLVALAAPQDGRARLVTLGVLLGLLVMPPGLSAIGVLQVATHAPPQLDWMLRSRLTVGLVLGLRFLPVATVVMMRAVGSLSPSWTDAARIHGVGMPRRFVHVILPNLGSAMMVSVLLVMVLAAADITTTHLLQPPGAQSLPVAIFTVMANAPEGLVASLCLLYLLCVIVLLATALLVANRCSETAT